MIGQQGKLVEHVDEPTPKIRNIRSTTLRFSPFQFALELDCLQFEAHRLIRQSGVRLCHASVRTPIGLASVRRSSVTARDQRTLLH